MTPSPLGFLGVGIMGAQMARRLAEAGHPVTAWNRTRAKAEPLAVHGTALADHPSEALADAAVAVVMLSDGPTCDRVLFTPDETGRVPATAMAPGGTIVVMSSISPAEARAQAGRAGDLGLGYVDAPVSGGEVGARDGTLAIMAGGDAGRIEAIGAVLAVMGRVTRVGDAGAGSLCKLCNQVIVADTIAAVAEALMLAEAGGADPDAVRAAITGGFADSTVLRLHGKRIIDRDWQPGGPAKHQLKDLRSAAAQARATGVTLTVTGAVETLFEAMIAAGDGDLDHAAVFREIERRRGRG